MPTPMTAYLAVCSEAPASAYEFIYEGLIPLLAEHGVVAVDSLLERRARQVAGGYSDGSHHGTTAPALRLAAASTALALGSDVVIALMTTGDDGANGSMDEVERALDAGKRVTAYYMRDAKWEGSSYMDGLFLARRVPMTSSLDNLVALLTRPMIEHALRQQSREWGQGAA